MKAPLNNFQENVITNKIPELERIENSQEGQSAVWQLVLLVLSIYVLLMLFIDTTFRLGTEQIRIVSAVDNLICFVFIGDFIYGLIRAKSKLAYLKWGWIDLVSSIPNIQILRIGRFARIIRLLRILRAVRSAKHLISFFYRKKAEGVLVSVSLIAFVVVAFSSISILNVESSSLNSNIKTAPDALWWAVTTLTTVGYGDKYPVTYEGKIIAVILMAAGIALVGTFTAYVASLFFEPAENKHHGIDPEILKDIKEIKAALKRIEDRY